MQWIMAGNDTEGLRYGTIETPEKYFLRWVEEGGPHSDGVIHLDNRYPYTLAALCDHADFETSRANCQELGRRLRELLRSRYAFGGLASTDGETVQSTEIGQMALESFGEIGGEYVHGALLNLTANTQI